MLEAKTTKRETNDRMLDKQAQSIHTCRCYFTSYLGVLGLLDALLELLIRLFQIIALFANDVVAGFYENSSTRCSSINKPMHDQDATMNRSWRRTVLIRFLLLEHVVLVIVARQKHAVCSAKVLEERLVSVLAVKLVHVGLPLNDLVILEVTNSEHVSEK